MRQSTIALLLLLFASGVTSAHERTRDRKRNNQQVERTVAADPRVLVSACVASGSLTVRSWDRAEVRSRISDGVQFELARIDQNKSPAATELKLVARNSRASCLPLGDIELDVPRGASLKLQSNNGDISVSDVARVNASSQAGSTTITRVTVDANVSTIGGEISVSNSSGSFKLHSVGGSVEARDLKPSAPGDIFEADTVGGDVDLKRVEHQRVRVNSVSGEVEYSGPLSHGGRYDFQSISGRLRLSLPADSSFRLHGTLGEDSNLRNDFNPASSQRDRTNGPHRGPMRPLDVVVGSGDASINLSFFSGSIQISKQ